MHLAILGSINSWHTRDLQRAAAGVHHIAALPFTAMGAITGLPGSSINVARQPLDEFDAVLVRAMPAGTLEQIIFRMDALGEFQRGGGIVVNPPRALEVAIDKYLSVARLSTAGLAVPVTFVCQDAEEAMRGLETLNGIAVVKPLFGSRGRGVIKVDGPKIARRVFDTLEQLGAVIYLQQFVLHHGFDYRVLHVGDRVLGMRRRVGLDWRTNVSQGATAEAIQLTPELIELSRRAAAAVGAPVVAVDLMPGQDGQLYCLEANAVPGWKALANVLQVDVARIVLDYLARRVAREN